jgi:hypothetical protein
MNDREIRCLFNKYRRIHVIFINRFFHFCAFCAFARTSFHLTSFARFQTYLTKCCRESSFSSNSFDSDVMIMRLIKFSTFMTNNLCSSIKWVIKWSNDEKKKRRKNVILCSKLFVHIFICDEFLHFFHDHWFTFSTYHFRVTSFSYIVFDRQREFLSSFIQYQDKHTNSIN